MMDPFNCSQIRKRKCHLQYVQHGTKQELWNNTPNDVRQTESIDSFKRELKSLYFKRLFNVFDGDNFRTFKVIFLLRKSGFCLRSRQPGQRARDCRQAWGSLSLADTPFVPDPPVPVPVTAELPMVDASVSVPDPPVPLPVPAEADPAPVSMADAADGFYLRFSYSCLNFRGSSGSC